MSVNIQPLRVRAEAPTDFVVDEEPDRLSSQIFHQSDFGSYLGITIRWKEHRRAANVIEAATDDAMCRDRHETDFGFFLENYFLRIEVRDEEAVRG